MHDVRIHDYIKFAARADRDPRRLTKRIMSACWPGGSADRIEPGGMMVLRAHGPERIAAHLPDCSCREGRCLLCN
jgi:hypothetical protein